MVVKYGAKSSIASIKGYLSYRIERFVSSHFRTSELIVLLFIVISRYLNLMIIFLFTTVFLFMIHYTKFPQFAFMTTSPTLVKFILFVQNLSHMVIFLLSIVERYAMGLIPSSINVFTTGTLV